jgi:hypothetical protein|tara:strand:+ start:288 stop:506 length:219 start_codon:yes stop_codon:yes gene_type:complete
MPKEYTDKEIEEVLDATKQEVDGWDIDTLIDYAYDHLANDYLTSDDPEKIKLLLTKQLINNSSNVVMLRNGG